MSNDTQQQLEAIMHALYTMHDQLQELDAQCIALAQQCRELLMPPQVCSCGHAERPWHMGRRGTETVCGACFPR